MSKTKSQQRGVYERVKGSGIYYARYRVKGKLYREIAGTRTQATKLYKLRTAEALQGKLPPALRNMKAVTFGELAKSAIEWSKINKKSFQDDVERLGLVVKWFGSHPADSITSEDVEKRIQQEAIARKWKPATCNRYRTVMSLAYRVAKVKVNPAREVTHLKEENQVERYLSDEEERRLKAVIKRPERWAAVLFSLNTGMRASEQAGLTWSAINANQATLPKTKNGTVRHVPLNQYALDALAVMRERPQPGDRVFHQQQHRVWFERALKAAKIPDYHWHCNRHTTATRLVKAGVPLHVVAAILGHKGLDMVLRYAHFAPDYLADSVNRLVVSTLVSTAA
jgi:integrase